MTVPIADMPSHSLKAFSHFSEKGNSNVIQKRVRVSEAFMGREKGGFRNQCINAFIILCVNYFTCVFFFFGLWHVKFCHSSQVQIVQYAKFPGQSTGGNTLVLFL